MSTSIRSIQIGVTAGFVLLGISCSLSGGSSNSTTAAIVKTCIIPSDQTGTIAGHWPTIPVPLAFHQGDFSPSEMTTIIQAAETWNKFYTASLNIIPLDYGTTSNPRVSSSADTSQAGSFCASGIIQGTQFNGNVVFYKLGAWPSAYPAGAIALTNYCPLPGKPYPTFFQAVIEINYQGFFVGAKVPDLQSIILHELGHLVGLKHSCEGTAQTGMPNCNDATLNPEYVTASMFPVFSFEASGAGQIKQVLGANDQGRANCLYTAKP